MHVLIRRVWHLLRRSRLEADLAEEMDFHREMKERELSREGTSPAETAAAARRALGSVALAHDRSRDVWLWPWLDGFLHDLRFALRGLRRDRAFTFAAIAMLALAIGLNVTVFTVTDAMLFRGFPLVKRNDRLVYLQERSPLRTNLLSFADVEEWRAQAHTFEGIGYVSSRPLAFRDGVGRPIDMTASTVSANTFGLLRVLPILGRDFSSEDETAGAAPVVILNYRFWEQRFAKRADVVVYGVSVVSRLKPEFLREITSFTGGRLFEIEKRANLSATFLGILDEFRHRYLVSYTPKGVAKDGWHKLEVRVKNRRATIKARPGYLAGT